MRAIVVKYEGSYAGKKMLVKETNPYYEWYKRSSEYRVIKEFEIR